MEIAYGGREGDRGRERESKMRISEETKLKILQILKEKGKS